MTAPTVSPTGAAGGRQAAIPIRSVAALCEALERQAVRFCHWKSNNALDRSAAGENDLDLLVARAHLLTFLSVLSACGFKPARAPSEKEIPGVSDYFGYDSEADKWVHVHAHYQLMVGHDLSKNYRIPIEEAFLESAIQRGIFKIPAPELEYIVFVIRMVLKHSSWDAILSGGRRLKPAEREELAYLQAQVDPARAINAVERHLPCIGAPLFSDCITALVSGSSVWSRVSASRRLQMRLRPYARRSVCRELWVGLRRRIASAVRWHIGRGARKYQLSTGGAVIAIVGGDGAGKSTAIAELNRWLSRHFTVTCAHLGKPGWTPLTIAVRGVLKLGHMLGLYGVESSMREMVIEKTLVSAGYAWLLREVCRARDRYRTYVRAARRAASGAIVIFDRFPLAQIEMMDGSLARRFISELARSPAATRLLRPRAESRAVRWLVRLEESYYRAMVPPACLIVLRVNPETAVHRKPEEKECHVRERSAEVWRINWERTGAHVVNADKPMPEVHSEMKTLIWSQL